MLKKIKNRGNMMFVLTVSALVMTIASAIAGLSCIILNSANDEILNNRLNFISSSAKAQILYRLQAKQYKSNSLQLKNLLEKDWENIVLGGENFEFDPSFDPSFEIDRDCQVKMDFNGGKYSSKCNFYGSFSSDDVPAYSMDLKISAVSNSKRKVFRAVISKKWPFCLSSGNYRADIRSGSIIDGDIYSNYKDGNIGISVKNNDCFPPKIDGDLILKKISNYEVNPNYAKNGYRVADSFQHNNEKKLGISFDSDSEKNHRGSVLHTENTFYTSGVNNAIVSLFRESQPKIIDDYLLNFEVIGNIKSYLQGMTIDEYLLSVYNTEDKKWMKETTSALSKHINELLRKNRNVYFLKKNLKLAGTNCEVEMSNPTLSSDSAYTIDGTLIAFPSCFKDEPEKEENEEFLSFGIEARNCTIYINGDLILIGDSKNLRTSTNDINYLIARSENKGYFRGINNRNTNEEDLKCSIPYLKGTKTSIVVMGNIFLSGAYIESAEDRLAIYSNENIYLKPVLLTDDSPQSVFKGALACRKSLKVVTKPKLNSNEQDLCRMKIYGALVCGLDDEVDDSNIYFKNKLFEVDDESVNISYLDITYSAENIDFLNRTIGVPMLTFWSDI